MSMFTRSGRAGETPPGSGDKYPLWLYLKNGGKIRGWYEATSKLYRPFSGVEDIHAQVESWEVIRETSR
jgi:hypothetical protein